MNSRRSTTDVRPLHGLRPEGGKRAVHAGPRRSPAHRGTVEAIFQGRMGQET